MSDSIVRRFVEGLLRGQSTEHARPDDFEAEQMKTAIELRAARLGSDAPREDFVSDLHRRLAAEMADDQTHVDHPRWAPRRRQVVIGGSVAAASAAAGLVVGRNLLAPNPVQQASPPAQEELDPNAGTWQAVGASADLPHGGSLAFDLGSVNGFITKLTFRFMLLKRAYTKNEFEELISKTKFHDVAMREDRIGVEILLSKDR